MSVNNIYNSNAHLRSANGTNEKVSLKALNEFGSVVLVKP